MSAENSLKSFHDVFRKSKNPQHRLQFSHFSRGRFLFCLDLVSFEGAWDSGWSFDSTGIFASYDSVDCRINLGSFTTFGSLGPISATIPIIASRGFSFFLLNITCTFFSPFQCLPDEVLDWTDNALAGQSPDYPLRNFYFLGAENSELIFHLLRPFRGNFRCERFARGNANIRWNEAW